MKLVRAILLAMTTVATAAHASVSRAPFGTLANGTKVDVYTLQTPELKLRVSTFGARVVSLETKDKNGVMGDVVLGYNDVKNYTITNKSPFFGAIVGRYGNRIAKGHFVLEGKPYQITLNDGPNALHGGVSGFDQQNWTAREVPNGVEFTLVSKDGDQGFPGTMTAHVTYTVAGNKVAIHYAATTDKPTVVNLTNHAYFNLDGEGKGDILNDVLTLYADKFTPVDATLIPTGELKPVAGTPFDFTKPTRIGERIEQKDEQLVRGKGYDHNWVLRGAMGTLHPVAKVYSPASGRVLEVATTEPGVQFYSGNFLDGSLTGKSGAKYGLRSGLCLETQHFPDSPNHPAFPTTELKPGQTMHSETTWTFSTQK